MRIWMMMAETDSEKESDIFYEIGEVREEDIQRGGEGKKEEERERQRERETKRERDKEREREIGTQRERERERDRQRQRERERETKLIIMDEYYEIVWEVVFDSSIEYRLYLTLKI